MPYKDPDEQRKAQRIWIASRRADHFRGKTCKKCGKRVNSHTADLDHIKPKRNRDGAKIWSKTKSKRDKEIKKTQILCKACHKKKTAKDLHNMAESARNIFLEMTLYEDRESSYDKIANLLSQVLYEQDSDLIQEEEDFLSSMEELDPLD